jgi:hypothetical protein
VAEAQKYTFAAPPGLQAQQQDLQAQRQAVYAQEQQLAQTLTINPRPHVVDASTKVGTPVPSDLTVLLPLGGLLGLIVGIALAAIREATSPTLNRDALARHFGAPLLGRIDGRDTTIDPWLAGYVKSAADAAGVGRVQLVAVGRRPADVVALADALDAAIPGLQVVPVQLPGRWRGTGTAVGSVGSDASVVVVAPASVKSRYLASLERHLQVTRQPVIGVIALQHGRQPVRRPAAHVPAPRDREFADHFVPNVVRDTTDRPATGSSATEAPSTPAVS